MKRILPIILLPIVFYSCVQPRYIYAPPPANVNYFNKKSDNKLTVNYSSDGSDGGKCNGIDVQAGYALTNHIAVIASYYHRSEKDIYGINEYPDTPDSSVVNYKRNFFEAGAGFFVPLNKKKTITFNLYGGMGLGSLGMNEIDIDTARRTFNSYSYHGNMNKYFMQGSFNFGVSKYFRLSFTEKWLSIYYGNYSSSYDSSSYYADYVNHLKGSRLSLFEHTTDIQFGFRKLNWMLVDASLTFCGYRGGTYSANNLDFKGANVSIGLSINPIQLTQFFKSIKSKK